MPVLDAQWIERRLGVARTTKQQERLADGEFLCCRPVYVGRNILLCGRKDGVFPFQCLVGPDWPCMVVTYAIITVPTIIFFVLVASQIGWLALLLGVVSFSMTILCFSLTACSDPGIVYRRAVDEELGQGHDHQQHQAQPPQDEGPQTHDTPSSLSLSPTFATAASDVPAGIAATANTLPLAAAAEGNGNGHNNNHSSHNSFTSPPVGASALVVHPSSRSGAPVDPQARIPCSRCEMSRPVGASHCYDCEVCVKGLDHHCPWTGKCIGQKNLCFFYAFLVCLTIHILYVGVVTGMNAITTGFHVNNGGGRQ